MLCAATAIALPAQTLTTLFSFDVKDGVSAEAALVQGTDGNFYGTTTQGGSDGDGTVFRITPSGTLTTLYSFCTLSDCTDGADPTRGLSRARMGTSTGQRLVATSGLRPSKSRRVSR